MKKIIFLVYIVFLICVPAKGQDSQELNDLLDREWKYDNNTIEPTAQNTYEKMISSSKDKKEIKDLKKNKELLISTFKEVLPTITILFNSNYELIHEIGREVIKENWTYDPATKTISYINSTSKEKNTLIIQELTASKLIYKDQYGYLTTLVPAETIKEQELDVSDFKKDLDIYKNIVETAHSGMYLYTSKKTFKTLFDEAYKKLPEINNTREFYKLIAGIHTKINCGHSSFHTTEGVFTEIKNNSTPSFFPFKVKFLKDTLVIAQDYKKLKKGTQIVSINGNKIENIIQESFKLISSDGYNTTFKYRQLEDDFSTNYFLTYGAQQKFALEYISVSGQQQNIEVSGIPLSELENTITETHYEKPYYLEYTNNSTALLTVNTFYTETPKNQKKFFKFLKESFREINKKGIQNLILDIRENTGGDDGNDMELASYLIDHHFKENKFRKLNSIDNLPPYPQYLLPQWFDMLGMQSDSSPETIQSQVKKEIGKQMYKGDDGAYYWKEDAVIHRDPAKHKFNGKVYILISGKVFSGGALFSALVRDKSDAVFIGEETGGGYYRHTGTIPLYYSLPNSDLIFSIFIVINEQDVDKKLFPEGSGTKPHHKVYPTINAFMNNTDVVMEKAKQLILESNN
ncbi:S41 family peptidase [Aquimarina sp. 2201CG5-10]|uniref:S41 family peptidase n=1 Tax=Aquimarina callyspongiae TaxID=3098150 RepID=UPI002AB41420|nr:S41 family peptidase [Aquimarina sp. 2201CG5-10]MDY8135545.1 S41 family peptidase [Aquimarina sp. 2201CG5-10]